MTNEISITLPGSIRSKKNSKRVFSCGRFTRVLPSKAYEEWEKQARESIWQAAIVPPLDGPIWVEAHCFYKGNRPDLSGAMESIGDCLEGLIYINDSQIVSWDGSRLYRDKENPRTEIIIRWGDDVL